MPERESVVLLIHAITHLHIHLHISPGLPFPLHSLEFPHLPSLLSNSFIHLPSSPPPLISHTSFPATHSPFPNLCILPTHVPMSPLLCHRPYTSYSLPSPNIYSLSYPSLNLAILCHLSSFYFFFKYSGTPFPFTQPYHLLNLDFPIFFCHLFSVTTISSPLKSPLSLNSSQHNLTNFSPLPSPNFLS